MTDLKKILVVDDDQDTRDLYKEVLEGVGYEVTTAQNGVEGLTYLEKGGFSLVLLDAMMPKLDGLTLLGKLKQLTPVTPNGPVLLLTNLSKETVVAQAKAAGADDCIIKTELNPDQLIDVVKKHVG